MNLFDTLPNEVLYEMCQRWDNPTLVNMSEAHSRIYYVCSTILKQREKEYEIKKLKDCIRYMIRNISDLNENILQTAEAYGNPVLTADIRELYPLFAKQDEELDNTYGEDVAFRQHVPWNEELHNQKLSEQTVRWIDLLLDKINNRQALIDLALNIEYWALHYRDFNLPDINTFKCIERYNPEFKGLPLVNTFWFDDDEKIARGVEP